MAVLFALGPGRRARRDRPAERRPRRRHPRPLRRIQRRLQRGAAAPGRRRRGGGVGARVGVRTLRHTRPRLAGAARGAHRVGRRNGRSAAPRPTPNARATPTSATTACSAGPTRRTRRWPPRTGVDRGWWRDRTSTRPVSRARWLPDRGTCGQNARCGIPALSRFGDTMDTMRQRILVVDDDPSLAEMLTIVLRGEGFDTAVDRRRHPGAYRRA